MSTNSAVRHTQKRRSKPHVLIVNTEFEFVYVERSAIQLLSTVLQLPEQYLKRMPPVLERALRAALPDLREQGTTTISPFPGIVMSCTMMEGEPPAIALQLERERQRDQIGEARYRYSLTKRECEVLRLVLQGMVRSAIASELSIAETTAADYVKTLLKKTQSKSRAEMASKLLGFDG